MAKTPQRRAAPRPRTPRLPPPPPPRVPDSPPAARDKGKGRAVETFDQVQSPYFAHGQDDGLNDDDFGFDDVDDEALLRGVEEYEGIINDAGSMDLDADDALFWSSPRRVGSHVNGTADNPIELL